MSDFAFPNQRSFVATTSTVKPGTPERMTCAPVGFVLYIKVTFANFPEGESHDRPSGSV